MAQTKVSLVDLNSNELILDLDGDTTLHSSTDDQIDIKIAGADDFTFTTGAFNVLASSHAVFADSSEAKFGAGTDLQIYHDGTNSFIANKTGALKIATETSGIAITIGHTTSEVTVADNLTVTGTLAASTSITVGSAALTEAELEKLDGITNGTVIANKAIVTDANIDITGGRNITISGELDAATLDISGDVDVDGTTNLDVVDIDGAVDMASTLGVAGVVTANAGVVVDNITIDGTEIDLSSGSLTIDVEEDITLDTGGNDVNFSANGTNHGRLSNTSSDFVIHSTISDKDLIFKGNDGGSVITALTFDMSAAGAATFNSTIDSGAITSTGIVTGTGFTAGNAVLAEAELELLDGLTAGTAIASKVVTTDANIDTTGMRNLTISGELDAATLDISGNADIDGTTNLDIVDIDGAVNIAADVTIASTNKIIFNDASQFIQGASNAILDIAATDEIELTATLIEIVGNATVSGTLGVTGVTTSNAGVVVDNITIDGTEIDLSSGDLTLDVAGDIILDADGGDIKLRDGGSGFGQLQNSSSDFIIQVDAQDKDIIFKGDDGGSAITPLRIDMSEGGKLLLGSGSGATYGQLGIESTGDAQIDLFSNVGSGAEGKAEIFFSSDSGSDHVSMASIVMQQDGAGDRKGEILFNVSDNAGPATAVTIQNNKNVVFGGGLAIGGTGSANTLDDYEEGTFAYTITGSNSGNLVLRTGYARGEYVKVGNVVHIDLRFETSSDNSIDGNLRWSLPFTKANPNASDAGNSVAPGYIRDNSLGTNARTGVYLVGESEAYAQLLFSREGAANSTVELANDGNTDGVIEGVISITYRTT